MKALHYIIGALLFLVLMVAPILVLSSAFQGGDAWAQCVDQLRDSPIEVIFGSLTLLFLVLLFALTGLKLPDKVHYLAYDIEGGTVSISIKAVQDFLAKLADEFAAVVSLDPHIRAIKGAVDVQLDVKVKAGAQIPELCRMLQERARESIKEKVGISDVREVRVRVQEIVLTSAATETTAADIKPRSFD